MSTRIHTVTLDHKTCSRKPVVVVKVRLLEHLPSSNFNFEPILTMDRIIDSKRPSNTHMREDDGTQIAYGAREPRRSSGSGCFDLSRFMPVYCGFGDGDGIAKGKGKGKVLLQVYRLSNSPVDQSHSSNSRAVEIDVSEISTAFVGHRPMAAIHLRHRTPMVS